MPQQHEIKITRDEAGRVVTTIDGKISSRGQGTDAAARRNAEFLARSYRLSGKDVKIVDALDADPQPSARTPQPSARTFRYTDLGQYSSEASDLGLAPGEWPETIEATHADGPTAGNRLTIHLRKITRDREGDVTHAEYVTGTGNRYLVWND